MENKQGGTAGVFPVPVRSVSMRPHILREHQETFHSGCLFLCDKLDKRLWMA